MARKATELTDNKKIGSLTFRERCHNQDEAPGGNPAAGVREQKMMDMENLSRMDILSMARKAADHITFHCDGISCGFEITHKGFIAFIDYESQLCSEERRESVAVPSVWDLNGKNYPEIAEALQCLLN